MRLAVLKRREAQHQELLEGGEHLQRSFLIHDV